MKNDSIRSGLLECQSFFENVLDLFSQSERVLPGSSDSVWCRPASDSLCLSVGTQPAPNPASVLLPDPHSSNGLTGVSLPALQKMCQALLVHSGVEIVHTVVLSKSGMRSPDAVM